MEEAAARKRVEALSKELDGVKDDLGASKRTNEVCNHYFDQLNLLTTLNFCTVDGIFLLPFCLFNSRLAKVLVGVSNL